MSLAPKLYYVLWILILIVQPAIVYVMARRKLLKEFPFFFHYIIFQVLSNLGVFAVYHYGNKTAYFFTFWGCTAVGAVLGFAVIYEIFDSTFRPFAALRDFSRLMFRWAGVLLLVVGTVMAFTSSTDHLSSAARCILGIMAVERGVMLVQGGLLLFLLMYSSRLGMTWQNQGFGIGLGLGFSACAHLILNSLRVKLGPSWIPMYDMLLMLCDNVVVATWAAYMFSAEPARVTEQAQFTPKPVLQRWNHVLAGGEESINGGTFIPSMERIVDRVMASQTRQSYAPELTAPAERSRGGSLTV